MRRRCPRSASTVNSCTLSRERNTKGTQSTFITPNLCRGRVTRQDNWSAGLVRRFTEMESWETGKWFLDFIGLKASALISLCCRLCQSLRDSTIFIYPWSDRTTSQSSNHLRLSSNHENDFAIQKSPKGSGRFILDVKWLRLTTCDEVMWLWTRPWCMYVWKLSSPLTGIVNKPNILNFSFTGTVFCVVPDNSSRLLNEANFPAVFIFALSVVPHVHQCHSFIKARC